MNRLFNWVWRAKTQIGPSDTCAALSGLWISTLKPFLLVKGQCDHIPWSEEATGIFSCVGFITSSLLIMCDGHFMPGKLMSFRPEGSERWRGLSVPCPIIIIIKKQEVEGAMVLLHASKLNAGWRRDSQCAPISHLLLACSCKLWKSCLSISF